MLGYVLAFYLVVVLPALLWAIPWVADRIDTRAEWHKVVVRAPAIMNGAVPALDDLEGLYY